MNVLVIDPSSHALGWSVFFLNKRIKCAKYIRSGVLRPVKSVDEMDKWHDANEIAHDDWIYNTDSMVTQILGLMAGDPDFDPLDKVLIEMPSVYAGGKGSVASNSGSIMKLMGTVMALRESLLHADCSVELVGVLKWKGQQDKKMTQKRVKRHWGIEIKDHNECDAVGIGDWYIRKFLGYSIVI